MLPRVPKGTYAEAVKSTPSASPVEGEACAAASSGVSCCASHNNAIDLSTKTETTSQVELVSSSVGTQFLFLSMYFCICTFMLVCISTY